MTDTEDAAPEAVILLTAAPDALPKHTENSPFPILYSSPVSCSETAQPLRLSDHLVAEPEKAMLPCTLLSLSALFWYI